MAVETGRVSLRERKKLQTRQALEDVALRLFAEQSFDEVTVEEIAEAVGVSSRTFFRYFGSKEDLVLGPMLDVPRVLEAALAARPASEALLDALRHATVRVAQHLEALRPQLSRRLRLIRTTPALLARGVQIQEELRGRLTLFAATRLGVDPRADLRPHLAAAWAMAGLVAARELWERSGQRRDLASLVAEAYDLLSGNLAEALAPSAGP